MKNKEMAMYSERMAGIKSSAIRDILKLTFKPGMISFAGGLAFVAMRRFYFFKKCDTLNNKPIRHLSNAHLYGENQGLNSQYLVLSVGF